MRKAPVLSRAKDRRDRGFKKNFRARLDEALKDKPLAPSTPSGEIWFQDEARIGQKNGLVYQWAKKGARPRQPKDQRYENAYIFGAICPARDTGAAIIMPYADTRAMQVHLNEISRTVAQGAHAVLLLDQAGWHTTNTLLALHNLTLPLPPKSPELNPTENIWQYLRQTWLSNRVFEGYKDICDACWDAWNKLIAGTGRIASIGTRDWAVNGQHQ